MPRRKDIAIQSQIIRLHGEPAPAQRNDLPSHEGIAAKGAENAKEKAGGEPLWRVPQHLAVFPSERVQPKNVKTGGSRELPSVLLLPSDVRLAGVDEYRPRYRAAERWVVPGSRLPGKFFGRTRRLDQMPRGHLERDKAAPLQSAASSLFCAFSWLFQFIPAGR